ncbi:MAG: protein BatD, partial [SAR324 cluster bacterium]|nr:protein BatD [SAR324 cluster bacterium]
MVVRTYLFRSIVCALLCCFGVAAEDTSNLNAPLFFIRHQVSNETPFVGEQIIYTIEFYSRIQLEISRLHFIAEAFNDFDLSSEKTTEIAQGYSYKVLRQKYYLYPLRPGKQNIITQRINLAAHLGKNSSPEIPTTVVARPLELNVKALPPLPDEYKSINPDSIIVGKSLIDLKCNPLPIELGQSRKLEVHLQSDGDLSSFKFSVEGTDGFRVYEEAPQFEQLNTGSYFLFKKVFTYTLLPLRGGMLKIKGAKILSFDPRTEMYSWLEAPTLKFEVQTPFTKKQESTPLNKQTPTPVPIKESLRYHEPNGMEELVSRFSVSSFLLLCTVIGLSFVTISLHVNLRKQRREKRLPFSELLRSSQDLIQLNHAFRQSLNDLLAAELDSNGLKQLLKEKIPDSDIRMEVETLLQDFSMEIYS